MNSKSVGILEVGFGNLPSLQRVLRQLDVKSRAIFSAEEIVASQYLIIPGVGSFESAMNFLEVNSLSESIRERCLVLEKPTLGICLGAQILLESGTEGDFRRGLGVFEGSVKPLVDLGVTKSHTGWDKVEVIRKCFDFYSGEMFDAYFNHDFYFANTNPLDIFAVCNYGDNFAVALEKHSTLAVQFHPEKSQVAGMKLIKSFLEIDRV